MAFEQPDRIVLNQVEGGVIQLQATTTAAQDAILQQIASLLAVQKQQATAAGQSAAATTLSQIIADLTKILAFVTPSPPVRLRLVVPTFTLKTTGAIMANFAMLDTQVAHIPVQTLNAENNPVPAPSGDVFTATSADMTQFTAGISSDAAGNPQCDITPMVQMNSAGVVITLSDSAGLAVSTLTVTVSRDTVPKSDFLDVAGVTFTTQPEPTTPGPG